MQNIQHFKLLQGLIGLNQVNQFSVEDLGTGLGPAESFLLMAVNSLDAPLIGDLAKMLNLTQGGVSTIAKRMVKRKLIKITTPAHDRRKSIIQLLPTGQSALEIYDQRANRLADAIMGDLNPSEKNLVHHYLSDLAEVLGVEPHPQRAIDRTYRTQIRRVTVGYGMLSSRVYNSNLTLIDWQILNLIYAGTHTIQEFIETLRIRNFVAAAAIRSLKKRMLIKVEPNSENRQKFRVDLRPAGLKAIQQLNNKFIQSMAQATKSYSNEQLELLIDCFRRMIQGGGGLDHYLDRELAIRRKLPVEIVKIWRRKIFAKLNPDNLPETLLSSKNEIVGLVQNGKLQGVAELDSCRIVNFYCEGITSEAEQSFIRHLSGNELPE